MQRKVHVDLTVASRVRLRVIELREKDRFHSASFDVAEVPPESTPGVSSVHAGVGFDLPDALALHALLTILKPLEDHDRP